LIQVCHFAPGTIARLSAARVRKPLPWVLLSMAAAVSASACNSSSGIVRLPEARACLMAIPFNATWAASTVQLVAAGLERYSFSDLYKHAPSPYVYQRDVLADIRALSSRQFSSDYEFQVRAGVAFGCAAARQLISPRKTLRCAPRRRPSPPRFEACKTFIRCTRNPSAMTLWPSCHSRQGWQFRVSLIAASAHRPREPHKEATHSQT